jgi:hypothetical protein
VKIDFPSSTCWVLRCHARGPAWAKLKSTTESVAIGFVAWLCISMLVTTGKVLETQSERVQPVKRVPEPVLPTKENSISFQQQEHLDAH